MITLNYRSTGSTGVASGTPPVRPLQRELAQAQALDSVLTRGLARVLNLGLAPAMAPALARAQAPNKGLGLTEPMS